MTLPSVVIVGIASSSCAMRRSYSDSVRQTFRDAVVSGAGEGDKDVKTSGEGINLEDRSAGWFDDDEAVMGW